MRSLAILVITTALSCSHPAPRLTRPRHVDAGPVRDVSSANLPPNEELDALLEGVHGVGRTVDVVRVAVPPFEALGLPADQAWLGEASADAFMTELTHVPGVTVLERAELAKLIDELKRSKDHGAQDLANAGKLLGAQLIVLGQLMNTGNGKLVFSIRPVRVVNGVSEKGFTLPVAAEGWHDGIAPAVAQLAGNLGLDKSPTPAPTLPLAPDRLEAASRARELQYQGKLVEAQPLYAKALAEPSSAWRFEADYLQLMADLGMYEWSAARAKELLLRIPIGSDTMCDRTRVFMQGNRAKLIQGRDQTGNAIEDFREVVRMAASCGQPELTAGALFYYAIAMNGIDHAMSAAANERALKILGGTNPYTACMLQLQQVDNDVVLGGNWHDGRDRAYEAAGEACKRAGNSRYSSVAFNEAASSAWSPARRAQLYDRSLELARAAGGQQLDSTLTALASDLRTSGHPTDADALLLRMIGDHLRALDALYGTLPDDVEQLDDDLLKRVGYVRRRGMPQRLAPADQLLANVHRMALAQALSSWVERTRELSVRQADAYQRVVDALRPPEPSLVGLDAQLAATKLPLADLEAAQSAPLRGSNILINHAWDALNTAFWGSRGHKQPAEVERLVAAIEKVASWYGAPAFLRKALLVRGQVLLDGGDFDGALAKARVSLRYAVSDPQWELSVNTFMRQVAERRGAPSDEVLELYRHRVEIARRVSPDDLVNATFELQRASLREHAVEPAAARDAIVAIGKSLAADKAWEPAALALATAADLWNDSQHVVGSSEAVALYKQRVEWLDQLSDPLRSVESRVEYLAVVRDAAAQISRSPRAVLAANPDAVDTSHAIAKACEELVAAGRARDAVRVAASLPPEAPDADKLLEAAEGWAKALQDSAEYPILIGGLHEARALAGGPRDVTVAQATLAHDAYAIGAPAKALAMYQLVIRNAAQEDAMWTAFQACIKETPTSTARYHCVWGVSDWFGEGGRPTNSDRSHEALGIAKEILPALDRHMPQLDRVTYRGAIAMLACASHDHETLDKTLAEIDQLTGPDVRLRANTLVKVAVVASTTEPKVARDLVQRITTVAELDDAWRANAYLQLAAAAHAAGDAARERSLLADGAAAAGRAAPLWLPRYDEYTAEAAVRKKDWRAAETAYKAAGAKVSAAHQQELRWHKEIDLDIGLVQAYRSALADARKTLASHVEEARRDATGGETESPCYDVEVLETAASVELAAGSCDAGEQLRMLATTMRARCVHRTCRAGEQMWCDETDSLQWKGTNACHKPLAGTFHLVSAN